MDFEDIAISRYTNLGGDQFDELVGDHFLRLFKSRFKGLTMSETSEKHLKARLLELAEQAKIDLSTELANRIAMGLELDQPVKTEILQPNIIDNKAFETVLTLNEYEKIVSPLLVDEISLKTLEEPEENRIIRMNILEPILWIRSDSSNGS